MRNLALWRSFCYLTLIHDADCRDDKDIKNQFRRQNAVGNMVVRKFSFAPIEVKIQLFKSYCYPIYGCALWHIHTRTLLENLLSVSVTHSSVLLTSYGLALELSSTDHINVVFRKFAYSLIRRVTASPNSIVTAIGNSDAYHQSPLIDKWKSMLYL